ncbi:hypothetical protein ABNC34_12945, partial [Paenibacillus larvae]
GYEYGSFHFLEPSFLHNYTDSTISFDPIETKYISFINFLSPIFKASMKAAKINNTLETR